MCRRMSFTDRVVPATYRDEEPVGFGVAGTAPDTWVFIPESIARRLVKLGEAYALHQLPRIELSSEVQFNSVQCQGLLGELQFIATVVDDQAVREALGSLAPLVNRVATTRSDQLVVSGP
jgi:hypothetical protein